jgi:hypothetical protein
MAVALFKLTGCTFLFLNALRGFGKDNRFPSEIVHEVAEVDILEVVVWEVEGGIIAGPVVCEEALLWVIDLHMLFTSMVAKRIYLRLLRRRVCMKRRIMMNRMIIISPTSITMVSSLLLGYWCCVRVADQILGVLETRE